MQMRKIPEYQEGQYTGMSRKTASMIAQEICKCAGEYGQTVLASRHLSELSLIIQRG